MELKPCPVNNHICLCQFCEDKCNDGLYCYECERSGKAEHTVYICTGFEGDTAAYLNYIRSKGCGYRRVGEGEKE